MPRKNYFVPCLSLCVLLLAGCPRKEPTTTPPVVPPSLKVEPATEPAHEPPTATAPQPSASAPSVAQPSTPAATPSSPEALAKPVVVFVGREEYVAAQGGSFIRYRFSVTNWKDFPNDLFVPAPELPPCGLNKNAARTWIDLFADGRRVYGFCALESSQAMGDGLSFGIAQGTKPPRTFFLRLHDRKLNRFSQSDVIDIPE